MKFIIITARTLSLVAVVAGIDFIIQHWSYGYLVFYSGVLVFALTFLLKLMRQ